MGNRCKVRAKRTLAGRAFAIVFLITFLFNFTIYSQVKLPANLPKKSDTVIKKSPVANDTLLFKKSITIPATSLLDDSTTQDTLRQVIDTFDVKLSKDTLDAPITYAASDSGVLIIPDQTFILYGKASTKYTDIEMQAATIKLDQVKQLVTAYGAADTLGNPLDKPKLVQGTMTSNSDSIFFNLKSQKGLTKSTFLQEGEMFIYANTIKKVDNNTLYAWRGRFTTCNLDTPHFAFRTRKIKIINQKLAVAGPTMPEIEGIPLGVTIPFGIYPLNRGRQSGILPPQFAANEDYGLGLEGLGYYKVLSEYLDVTVRTNIYSYGGWNLNVSPRYMKRYRYQGGLSFTMQNTIILNRFGSSKEEFTKNKSFMLSWNHSRDSKARPGTSFSANVNAGSTKFNRYVPNNAVQNFQNQLSSSISYSKDWRGKYNMTVSANHNQNNASRLINLNLPTVNFNVVTIYPFQKAEQVGQPKWYEKLGVAYTGNIQNQVSFYDSAFNLRRLLDTTQWGASHNIPITLSLPALGPLQLGPSVSFEERWYGQKVLRSWNRAEQKVDTAISRGFYAARQMSFGISANTRIFGTYQFPKSNGIKAIRHEIRPNLSLNYKPDFMKRYFYNTQVDSSGRQLRFSQFEGGVMGSFGEGKFGGIGFGIDNMLEMKVKSRKDTANGGIKKIKLIDGFGFSSAYNLVADSFALSPVNLYLRSTLFEKINITANATLDPYDVDSLGVRQKNFVWNGNQTFSPGRITNGSISISTQLQSKSKDGRTDAERSPKDEYMTPEEQQRQLDYVRSNPAEYTDFNIPWTLSLSYSLSYTKQLTPDYKMRSDIYQTLSVNGDFSLTPRWKMGGSTYYDIKTRELQTLTMFISREMHCWQLSINLTPVGLYRSFNISLYPKSGILRDLKINRSRFFTN